jgi:molecular chaperone GrpE
MTDKNNRAKPVKINIKDSDEAALPKAETENGNPLASRIETEDKDPNQQLEKKIEALGQEAQENYDRFLRVSAEFENYKKRMAREVANYKKYANESLLKDMLSLVDNLERAIQSATGEGNQTEALLQGIHLTLKETMSVMEKFHVAPIEAIGQPFDPAFHEAVLREASDQHDEHTVLSEIQKGYTIHERLLRPSMVVVSMKSPKTDPK